MEVASTPLRWGGCTEPPVCLGVKGTRSPVSPLVAVSPTCLVFLQDTVVALEALAQMWLQWGRGSTAGLNLGLSWPGGARGRAGGTQVTLKPGLEPLEQELQVGAWWDVAGHGGCEDIGDVSGPGRM